MFYFEKCTYLYDRYFQHHFIPMKFNNIFFITELNSFLQQQERLLNLCTKTICFLLKNENYKFVELHDNGFQTLLFFVMLCETNSILFNTLQKTFALLHFKNFLCIPFIISFFQFISIFFNPILTFFKPFL
ncbi:hypothetical protein RFI_03828 [Reticulomyxa filosa]|uniref:Transmembrane protein n=1 Tax=Reticulomyxa filosa TaxID=46433 RepID=X6P5B0_RETFI|nr:hypothetical protein RFI_03828 [Reticulomyxa filosa]|eukprot:ETO33279.1 hypothetical protein RFI_03828 [Reticulomyxa filosa]